MKDSAYNLGGEGAFLGYIYKPIPVSLELEPWLARICLRPGLPRLPARLPALEHENSVIQE